jgi:hypothetical protein
MRSSLQAWTIRGIHSMSKPSTLHEFAGGAVARPNIDPLT